MFNPSPQDVRRFFCETYRKGIAREILTPLEIIAFDWIKQHSEYQTDLANVNAALEKEYSGERGETNPFLHLSLHLTISEQISIDQPKGITPVCQALMLQLGSEHEAQHVIMEVLATLMWESQRYALPFESTNYIALIQKELEIIKKRR